MTGRNTNLIKKTEMHAPGDVFLVGRLPGADRLVLRPVLGLAVPAAVVRALTPPTLLELAAVLSHAAVAAPSERDRPETGEQGRRDDGRVVLRLLTEVGDDFRTGPRVAVDVHH